MAKNDIIYVTIPNWDRYQERPDRGNFLWFKLLNGYFDDAKIFELGAHGKLVYVYILCQVSKSGGGVSSLHLDKVSTELKIKKSEISNTVNELRELSLVTLEELPGSSGNILEDDGVFLPRGEEKRGEERREAGRSSGGEILKQIWEEHRGTLPSVRSLSIGRRRHAAARWKENPDAAYWIEVVKKLAASEFCQGKNDRGWKADFEFLLRPETHVKAMEGKYDNWKPQSTVEIVKL